MWPALMRNLWGAVRYWWQMADNLWHKSFIPKLILWHKSSFPKLILWHISSIQNLILCILGYVSLGHISVRKRERNEEEYIQFSARFPNKMLHSISLQFPALFAISNNCPQRCSSFNTCCGIQDFKKCFFPFFYQKTQVRPMPDLVSNWHTGQCFEWCDPVWRCCRFSNDGWQIQNRAGNVDKTVLIFGAARQFLTMGIANLADFSPNALVWSTNQLWGGGI